MTEFEQQLLQHLQKQADQLTALSLSQSQTTAALLKISEQQAAIFRELSKAPEGESMKNAMAGLLKPLEGNLSALEGRSASCWTCRSCRTIALAYVHVEIARQKRLELEARKPVGITPSSRYHPDNMAKRAARGSRRTRQARAPHDLGSGRAGQGREEARQRCQAGRRNRSPQGGPAAAVRRCREEGAMGRCNQGRADAVPQGIHRAGP